MRARIGAEALQIGAGTEEKGSTTRRHSDAASNARISPFDGKFRVEFCSALRTDAPCG
jgi:hypothetical protein